MAGPLDLKGTVRIVDRASGPLRRVATGLAAIGRHSGVRAIGRSFAYASTAAQNFAGQLTGLLGPIAAVTGLAGIGGIVASISTFSSRIDDFTKFGRTVGLTGQQMRELEFASNRQGASFATVKSALIALNKRTGELKAGTGGLFTFLKKANPQLAEQFKQAKTLEEQIALTADAYKEFEKNGQGFAFLAAAFSRGGAAAMSLLLAQGKEGLRGLTKEARQYMGVVTNQDTNNVEAYTDSMANMEGALRGIAMAVSRHVLPVLTPMINQFARFLADNRELIGQKVGEWFADVADYVKSIDWAKVANGFDSARASAMGFVEAIGGVDNLFIGLGVLVAAPFLASLVQLAGAFVLIGYAIGAAALAAGGPVVAAFVALGALAYVVAADWNHFKEQFTGLVADVKGSASGLADVFRGLWNGDAAQMQAGAQKWIADIGNVLRQGIAVFNGILAGALGGVDLLFGTNYQQDFRTSLHMLGTIAESMLAQLKGQFQRSFDAIGNVGQSAWDKIKSGWRDAFSALPNAAETAIAKVRTAFEAFANWLRTTWVGRAAAAVRGAFSGIKAPNLPRGAAPEPGRSPVPAAPTGGQLLKRSSYPGAPNTGPGSAGHATLEISLPGGMNGKVKNGGAGKPAFDNIRLNRGPAMRGLEA